MEKVKTSLLVGLFTFFFWKNLPCRSFKIRSSLLCQELSSLYCNDVPGRRITMSLSSFQSLERGYNHLYFYSAEVHCTQYKHAIIYQNDIFV